MIRAAKAQQIDDPKARDTCHSRGGPPGPDCAAATNVQLDADGPYR
jgi:hypothetical protein